MEIQTILSTFLGITQEVPMGGSWVILSVTSLTERSVYNVKSNWKVTPDFCGLLRKPGIHGY